MQIETMRELYADVSQDLYDAEQQILEALPRMAQAATSEQLQNGFEEHLRQTEVHVKGLDQVFSQLGETPQGKTCKAIEGLLEEGEELMDSISDAELLDAALIAAAQKVEHYEIATYGCARTYAELLGETQAADLLQETLDEEKLTDDKLTDLAMSEINVEAAKDEPGDLDTMRKRPQPEI